jgi:hypothetical protein
MHLKSSEAKARNIAEKTGALPAGPREATRSASAGKRAAQRTTLQRARDYVLDDVNQIRALVLKSLVLQWRQWKTNLCQLIFPAICCAFIFLLQVIFAALNQTVFPPDKRIVVFNTTSTSMSAMQSSASSTSVLAQAQN